MSKKISIVLICFNQEDYIVEALDGIRNQTETPHQVIIADDASKDKTQVIIRDYVNKYALYHWTLLLSEKNRGITENLQRGLNECTGEIIIAMAGDDISLPERCAVTDELFSRNPQVNVVANSGYIINSSGEITGEKNEEDALNSSDVVKVIRFGFPGIHPVGQAFRSVIFSKYGPLPLDVPNEDDQLSFRGIVDGGILTSSIKTYKYRVHEGSASSWIRNKQSSEEFYRRFTQDMVVRERHMRHWITCIQISPAVDKEYLTSLLKSKITLYEILSGKLSFNIFQKISFLLKNHAAICTREQVYLLFGKYGVLGWRKARHILGKV